MCDVVRLQRKKRLGSLHISELYVQMYDITQRKPAHLPFSYREREIFWLRRSFMK